MFTEQQLLKAANLKRDKSPNPEKMPVKSSFLVKL